MIEDTVEKKLAELGTPADVLSRHGVDIRGRKAACPFHDDRHPSLSLFNKGGRDRWHCHVCGTGGDSIDLARLLGETVELRAEPRGRQLRRAPSGAERRVRRLLAEATVSEIVVGARLAQICRRDAEVEVRRNLGDLRARGDLGKMIRVADALRAFLPERFGVPREFYWRRQTVAQALIELAS